VAVDDAGGLTPISLQVSMGETTTAQCSAPPSDPTIERSTTLQSISLWSPLRNRLPASRRAR
jgi:hypothetical protein